MDNKELLHSIAYKASNIFVNGINSVPYSDLGNQRHGSFYLTTNFPAR